MNITDGHIQNITGHSLSVGVCNYNDRVDQGGDSNDTTRAADNDMSRLLQSVKCISSDILGLPVAMAGV